MSSLFEYFRPSSLKEAYELLEEYGEEIYVKAGGTDLLVGQRAGKVSLKYVLGLEKIEELKALQEEEDGTLSIGSLVKVNDLSKSPTIQKKVPFLSEAALTLGSHQIRNLATVGGNLSNGKPSADLAPILICLESVAQLGSSSGIREIPLKDFFVDAGKTGLKPGELLLALRIPPNPSVRGIYLKHSIRNAMDCCVIGVGCALNLEGDLFQKVRITLGAVAPTPVRAVHVEQLLEGQKADGQTISRAIEESKKDISPISDMRGSKEYRSEMIKILIKRGLYQLAMPSGATHVS